ncbi:lycopene beta-cyclase CrtY [Mariniblastus sp.]|nr:lycopene beta-cyclase CrtY [Mariniblastus sp.]MDA7904070.1 lycopene beta-cyclase CrtY [bacterium]MDA7908918.1 lycopene beta-cyclase CrtY [bacterium]
MIANEESHYDYVIVGGGLQAGLLALAFNYHQPSARVLLIEKSERLCGNHTWSFHATDVPAAARGWLASVSSKKWRAYAVKFPGFEKRINLGYESFSSAALAEAINAVEKSGNLEIITGKTVHGLTPTSIETDCGFSAEAKVVLDCRGAEKISNQQVGFQKFYGMEVELADRDWPAPLPTIMDATVEQTDGFRFFYVLPLTRRRVLIEDTFFSNSPTHDHQSSATDIEKYLFDRDLQNWTVRREESGCLPMPFGSSLKPNGEFPLRGGFRGGWFHAATGYSFPLASRFADSVASASASDISAVVTSLAKQNQFQTNFSRFLNRLLFQLVTPDKRFLIFQRFYRSLNEQTIRRFYSHEFTKFDAARLLIGSPPQGLTPIKFFKSFKEKPCPALQS